MRNLSASGVLLPTVSPRYSNQCSLVSVSAASLAVLAAFMPVSSAFAATCITGVTTGTTDVVQTVSAPTANAVTGVTLTPTTATGMSPILFAPQTNPPTGAHALVAQGGFVNDYTYDGVTPPFGYAFNGNFAYADTQFLTGVTPNVTNGQFVSSVTTTTTPVVSSVTTSNGGASSVAGGLACGDGAFAGAATATANGPDARAEAAASSAYGSGSRALGTNSTAFGSDARATASGATAVGEGSRATGVGSTAVGQGANAGYANSTAIGAGATTTRENQMTFGTGLNTYTAPGITSAASKAAQSGPLEVVTSDASGNLATDGGAIFSSLNKAFRKIDENSQGIAIALAMGGISVPDSKNFSITAGYGNFDGTSAFASQMAVRLDQSMILTGGVGVGLAEGDASSKVGGRVGVQVSW